MVVDNSRVYEEKDDRFASYLFEILPKNIHIIGIRRATPVHTYSKFSGDSNFDIYGPIDLKFSQTEVLSVLEIHGLDTEDQSILEIADLAKGWPAALQMISHNLTRGRAMQDLDKIMASDNEPLTWLVSQVLSSLTAYERESLSSLAAVQSFNYEIAEVILGNGFKKNELNGFALDGLFFEQANSPERTFTFHSLMRESLLNELHKNPEREKSINSRLSHFFERNNQHLLAVEHAQSAGEFERVQELFKEAARVLASKGEGQELIRWSKFIGDDSNFGLRLRQTVEVMGLTVDFKFNEAMSLIDEMRFGAKGLPIEDFISKFTNLTEAFIAFSYFRRKDFDRIFKTIAEPVISFDISLNERLAAKRLEASIAFLLDDYEGLVKIHQDAIALGSSDVHSYMKFHLDAIDAMKLYGDGRYQDAYETASSALTLAKREGFVGITGFVDIMYVQALCLIEFAQVDEGLQKLNEVQELAERWSIGPFYFQAVSRIARTLAARGEITEALEMLRGSREYAASFKVSHEFDLFNDLTELSIRAKVADWDRVRILLDRAPEFLLSKQLKISMEEANSGFRPTEALEGLPENTPRRIIEKNLALARCFAGQESIALGYVRKALDSGAQVQAVETFLRLDVPLLNLILKAGKLAFFWFQ
jgi:ATP/maltotriose-dependent transcriptional regulator MalT